MSDHLVKLEEELSRIQGVRSARVVGEASPTEIHIVASPERSPKQVVRDVQSLAAAGFGISIDHRIVSVVQLGEASSATQPETEIEEPSFHRPVLDRVVLASKGSGGWVKVGLRWPDGEETEGASSAGATREARARGAAAATAQALEPMLSRVNRVLDIDQVMIHRLGPNDSVLVRANLYDLGVGVPLVGSALVYDDVATAAVRAVLHAINRKLQ